MRLRAISAVGLGVSLLVGMNAAEAVVGLDDPTLDKKKTTTTTTPTTTSTSTSTTSTSTTTVGAQPVVAIIDTGVRATHDEFDYDGPNASDDQFVGWWDFSSDAGNHLPLIGQTWDTVTADPHDPNGHGTATASLAVGLNAASAATKYPSFAPGFKLAVAKVGNAAGELDGDIAAAVRWARESVRADVVSISIGGADLVPAFVWNDIYREIRLAREAGVLVLVSNGNGFQNAGVPGQPGATSSFANSPHALGVGASDIEGGVRTTTDPEVTALFWDVPSASNSCDECYAPATGTSFGTPIVAGFAAALKKVAVDSNQTATPAYLETLVKYSAEDTVLPPTFEGYGAIDHPQYAAAAAHAAAGTLPVRPDPDVDGLYVETVQGTLDDAWVDKASTELERMTRSFIGSAIVAGEKTLGPSAPTGVSDAEVYEFEATAGQTVSIDADYLPQPPDGVADFDVYVFRPVGSSDTFTGEHLVTKSTSPAAIAESIDFVAPVTGKYAVVVMGWSIATNQQFSLTASVPLELVLQDFMLNTFGTGLFL